MYQHFVPQFLLRNFAHPYRPPKHGEDKTATKKPKPKYVKGKFPGDSVLSNVDLQTDPACITESPVKRILGRVDMYRDTTKPSAMQQEVEQMLSRLEGQAAGICQRIKQAFEGGHAGLWLTRDDRNLLRKFLFLLKYRGDTFRRRFYHESVEGYDANDKERLRKYMREKGFKRPLDVWFHNLKTIMQLKMDANGHWIREIHDAIYPEDAIWFVGHVQMMYMAICTPERRDDEFILTDNAYNISEGPSNVLQDPGSDKEAEQGAWANLHEFAPISPKLMIVLRSNILPVPEEDSQEAVRRRGELWRWMAIDSIFAKGSQSLLHNLPIRRPRNSYSRVVDGRVESLDGQDTVHRKTDRFFFDFFPISSNHVYKINALLLDNAYACTTVVFSSQNSLAKSLEWYLTAPTSIGKRLIDHPHLRLACLKKLDAISKSLGSTREPVWTVPKPPCLDEFGQWRRRQYDVHDLSLALSELYSKADDGSGEKPMDVYGLLGGSPGSFVYDMEQSVLMLDLRIKIDVWSQGVNEHIRERNMSLLVAAYLRLPPQRVWLWVKIQRDMLLGLEELVSLETDQPEDIIARSHSVFGAHGLTRPMYTSLQNVVEMKTGGGFDPWAPITCDEAGEMRLIRFQKIVFFIPGTICDCGIPEIEQLAKRVGKEVLEARLYEKGWFAKLDGSMMPETDKIELLARIRVRSRFEAVLKGSLESKLLSRLKSTFFEVTYPTPPMGENIRRVPRRRPS